MATRLKAFVITRIPNKRSKKPSVPWPQKGCLKIAPSWPLRARAREMSSMLNMVALMADAVAMRAATDTAMKPHMPKTG